MRPIDGNLYIFSFTVHKVFYAGIELVIVYVYIPNMIYFIFKACKDLAF